MGMIINWLVFSDLHFQFKNFDTSVLRKKLIDFLSDTEQQTDFILIAGDCFYGPSKQEKDIDQTVDFIHKLISACTCDNKHVYIIPGNHDLQRTEQRLIMLSYYTGINYETGETVGKCKSITDEALKTLFNDKYFSGFLQLYKKIVGTDCSWVHKLWETDNYRILSINTCVLSGGYYHGKVENEKEKNRHYDEGALSIKDDIIFAECVTIKRDNKINIAFMHHGTEYLRKKERESIEQFFEDNHIDIVFSGHSHTIGLNTYNSTKNKLQQFTCGAPILDDYSEPSFFKCSFNTENKHLTCTLYSYSKSSRNWGVANNQIRSFTNGIYDFVPSRFISEKILDKHKNEKDLKIITNCEEKEKYFNDFGIINALPYNQFISLRNKLIIEAEGDVIIVGQSLQNAFDIRKDSESIVECIKNNKKIKNIDIFLTDPIMYDSTSDLYGGDTPISRIDKTMHTILYEISKYLAENQSINIYFIPLVQLDHMVFVGDILLLRHTLLWTSDTSFKATPLVCKNNKDNSQISESISKSSMYNVYYEYIKKLKDASIIIDIKNKGYERQNETLAKKCHRSWRHKLYNLRNSKEFKGTIIMHKLYRRQLISDLHSSWDPRFRSFSSEVNWGDCSETSYFNFGENTKIYSYKDLFDSRNLLNDSTQNILLPYIEKTENMLNELVKKYDDDAFAKIFPSLDIGIPNNVLRLAGGFATGMLVVWKCGTPIVPIDTTVNVCSSSYYQFDAAALKGQSIKEFFNAKKINEIINEGSKKEGIAFSFNSGNHFLLLCKSNKNGMYYLVLHSSAKQFKDTYLGLYPKPRNWYSGYIKTYYDKDSKRYIRYLKDVEAERFIKIARMLNQENEDIHNWFAGEFCPNIHFTKCKTYHHYGMPTDYAIAIGTYVIDENDIVPIFSKEDYPICFFKPDNKMWSIELEGKKKYIVPHGWGQKIKSEYFTKMDENNLSKCFFSIENNNLVLKNSHNKKIGEYDINYNNRFPEDMIEVRQLWDLNSSNKNNMLKFDRYLSGTIEEVLYPIALFSKNNDEVKYYDVNK
jgi:UDP-2,3-diacylglucosamine pyrophosphatase LpxH